MPATWTALVVFLLFVVPGLVFDDLSQRRRPNADESAFRETSRVVRASVWLAIPGLLVSSTFFWGISRGRTPEIGKIVGGDGRYLANYDWELFGTICVFLGTSIFAAYFYDWCLRRKHGATLTSTRSMWTEVFRNLKPDGADTYVRVATTSGQYWSGMVGNYSADVEVSGRELVLREPISRGDSRGEAFSTVQGMKVLILRGDVLESVQVFYISAETPA